MAVVLFDTDRRSSLHPFTYTKAVAHLSFGLFTIQQRWQHLLGDDTYVETAAYLQRLYQPVPDAIHTWINACVLPFPDVIDNIKSMQQGDVLEDETGIIACNGRGNTVHDVLENAAMNFITITSAKWLLYPHQMLQWNDSFIQSDFALLTKNKIARSLPGNNQYLGTKNIFIEEDASVAFAIINAEKGPVYIGKGATVMEGSLLKGPIFIGEGSVIKMGAKIYGAASIGHHSTVGGEIKNVIMQPYSNKAHDGYLGDSIIGEWCNIGAGVTNSNVKNTGGDIMVWNEYDNAYINVGNKCGVMMGDYTRVAINSSINTGSVYGICCNVFGEGLLPAKLRNFSWGVGGIGYALHKAIRHIGQWKNFKQQHLTAEEKFVLTHIFDNSIGQR